MLVTAAMLFASAMSAAYKRGLLPFNVSAVLVLTLTRPLPANATGDLVNQSGDTKDVFWTSPLL